MEYMYLLLVHVACVLLSASCSYMLEVYQLLATGMTYFEVTKMACVRFVYPREPEIMKPVR